MQIIPAIDILDGKCVRLSQGEYETAKIYQANPITAALEFQAKGFKRIHVVDLDGAKAGQVVNYKILKALIEQTTLEIDFGGGIKTETDLENVLELGTKCAVIGSLAIKNTQLFETWLEKYGSDKIVLMLDVKGDKVATMGWQENTETNIYDILDQLQKKVKHVFCTDISKDGMLEGPNFELYSNLIHKYPQLLFTASGGVSSIADLEKLATLGLDGAIVGKALYECQINIENLKTHY